MKTLIFAALGEFGCVRTCPYFLAVVGGCPNCGFGLPPRSHVQLLSQPVSGLHAKAVLLRVHHLPPVSCCCGFCKRKPEDTSLL